MNYTYRQLLEALLKLSQEELDLNVTIYDSSREEYYPLNYTGKTEGDDVLDSDHPVMIVNDPEEEINDSEDEEDCSVYRMRSLGSERHFYI